MAKLEPFASALLKPIVVMPATSGGSEGDVGDPLHAAASTHPMRTTGARFITYRHCAMPREPLPWRHRSAAFVLSADDAEYADCARNR